MCSAFIPSRTDDAIAFIAERAQAEIDEIELVEYERRERAAQRVTFDDVLEYFAGLSDDEKANVMQWWDQDRAHFNWKIASLFADGIEHATKLYLKSKD